MASIISDSISPRPCPNGHESRFSVGKSASLCGYALCIAGLVMNRCRLEAQGYRGHSDAELRAFGRWLRFAPTLCTLGIVAGTALASPAVLALVGATALVGSFAPRHPFDYLYMHAVRPILGSPAIPPTTAERKFACAMATAWLAATAIAFQRGALGTGYALGTLLASVAALVSATDFCVPSLIYGYLKRRRGWL